MNIRRRPNTASDILAVASAGDTFPVLGENDDGSWINILLPDGIEAWIASFLVEQVLAPADDAGSPDASARAGDGRTVLRFDFSLRLGKTPAWLLSSESAGAGAIARNSSCCALADKKNSASMP